MKLGEKMNIPNTAVLSLRAPFPLFDMGYMWYPEVDEQGMPIKPIKGEKRRVAALDTSVQRMLGCLEELRERGGWDVEHVFLIGFAQGSVVALDCALRSKMRLGGVICISGGCFLPELLHYEREEKSNSGKHPEEGNEENAIVMLGKTRAWRQNNIPLFVSHGMRDPQYPLDLARQQYQALLLWREKFSISEGSDGGRGSTNGGNDGDCVGGGGDGSGRGSNRNESDSHTRRDDGNNKDCTDFRGTPDMPPTYAIDTPRAVFKAYPKPGLAISSAEEMRDLCAFLAPLLHLRSPSMEVSLKKEMACYA